jgi:ABC-type Mn2+/Zn2+ transport system ATPase subunit
LARAIASDSEMLVLDEPTAGMDVASEAAMMAFLQELNRSQKLTIVIVTHLLQVVLNLATSVMLLGTHSILQGPLDQILQEQSLTDLYGAPVHIGAIAGQRTLVVGRPGAQGV